MLISMHADMTVMVFSVLNSKQQTFSHRNSIWIAQGQIYDLLRGGANPEIVSLKQGVWGA